MKEANIPSDKGAEDRPSNWLAPAGTVMAMMACYGLSAGIGVLSLIGISVAFPFRAEVIILFSAIAAASLAGSYRRHHSRLALGLALVGFSLIAGSKFLPLILKTEAIGIEGVGFICMVAANVLAFRARRLGNLSCAVQRAG